MAPTRKMGDVVRADDALFSLPPQPTSTSLDDYYLDRTQRNIVQSYYGGPVRVLGACGTGKTVVALHRAKFLAETGHSVLLCAFNKNLARRISEQFTAICPRERQASVQVADIGAIVGRTRVALLEAGLLDAVQCVEPTLAERLIEGCPTTVPSEHLIAEWEDFVCPRALWSRDEYLSLKRTGAALGMGPTERRKYWEVYGSVRQRMFERGQHDRHSLCRLMNDCVFEWPDELRFDAVLVDECQDLGLQELRFLMSLARDPRLFMVFGDPAQRILAPPQTLSEAGIRCPGARTFVLDRGHRCTSQISEMAARALEGLELDWDGVDYVPASGHDDGHPVATRAFERHVDEEKFLVSEIQRLKVETAEGTVGVLLPTIATGIRLQAKLGLQDVRIRQVGCDSGPSGREDGVQLYWQSYNSAKGMEFDTCIIPRFTMDSLRSGVVGSRSAKRDRMRLAMLAHVLLSRARRRLVVTWCGDSALDELVGQA